MPHFGALAANGIWRSIRFEIQASGRGAHPTPASGPHHVGLGGGLAGDLGLGVLLQAGIQDGIGHLVAELQEVGRRKGWRLAAGGLQLCWKRGLV